MLLRQDQLESGYYSSLREPVKIDFKEGKPENIRIFFKLINKDFHSLIDDQEEFKTNGLL